MALSSLHDEQIHVAIRLVCLHDIVYCELVSGYPGEIADDICMIRRRYNVLEIETRQAIPRPAENPINKMGGVALVSPLVLKLPHDLLTQRRAVARGLELGHCIPRPNSGLQPMRGHCGFVIAIFHNRLRNGSFPGGRVSHDGDDRLARALSVK